MLKGILTMKVKIIINYWNFMKIIWFFMWTLFAGLFPTVMILNVQLIVSQKNKEKKHTPYSSPRETT